MAFDAGAVVAKFVADTSQWTGGMKSMTGSMFKAQAAFAVFQKVVQGVVDVTKDTIGAFNTQQKVLAQQAAVLKSTRMAAGLTSKELQNMASALQKTTTFGDEAVIGAQNIMLTFTKVGKEVFPQATETVLNMSAALGQDLKQGAIQVGKALQDPLLGITALRRVGVQLSEQQEQSVKDFMAVNDIASAQKVILEELETQFGGSAEAMRQTFGGAVQGLQNDIGDLQEIIGGTIAAGMQPFVEEMDKMVLGMNEFLKSTEGMEMLEGIMLTVSAVFRTFQDIIGDIVQHVQDIGDDFVEIFDLGDAQENLAMLNTILSNIRGAISVLLEIGRKLLKEVFKALEPVIKSITTGLSDLFEDVEDGNMIFTVLGAIVNKIGLAFSILGKFLKFNIDLFIDMIKLVKTGGQALIDLGAAMADLFNEEKRNKAIQSIQAIGDSFVNLGKNAIGNIGGIVDEATKAFMNVGKDVGDTAKDIEDAYTNAAEGSAEGLKKLAEQQKANNAALKNSLEETKEIVQDVADASGDAAEETKDAWEESVKSMQQGLSDFQSTFMTVFNAVDGVFDQHLENRMTAEDNAYKRQKELIENNVTDEESRTAQLEALEKEHNKKQAALKREAFLNNKVGSVIESVINTALGVTKMLSSAPFPVNMILAGIVGAFGAAQTALIAAQPVPAFAAGGVGRGTMLVGEEGPELINLGTTSRIFPADETRQMMGAGGVNINFNDVEITKETDVDKMIQLAGSRLMAMKRGA